MKITTAGEMREIDRRATAEFGIPGVCLMQSAGEKLAGACVDLLGGAVSGKTVVLVCGKGNNGGDGFVAARHLVNQGANVTVLLAALPDELKGDAAAHFAPLPRLNIAVTLLTKSSDLAAARTVLPRADLIADALLGTGVHGPVEGLYAEIIAAINAAGEAGVPIVSADIPSGVEADTGRATGAAVRATRTVTFALPKRGLLLFPGQSLAGAVTVAAIGIPRMLLDADSIAAELTTGAWVRARIPARFQSRDTNKGSFGSPLVIAGSGGMAGAAALCAASALRAGAGLVVLAVPESVLDSAAILVPEVVTKPLPETGARAHGGPNALERALELAAKADAVAIGPGMGQNPKTGPFVQTLAARLEKPLVMDADALNAIAQNPEALQNRSAPTVLTPHPGEMGRLLGKGTGVVQKDRPAAARAAAEKFNAVVLLKGARTLIATPSGELFFNRLGTPALATAGTGDVLTGVIVALLGQGLSARDAARAGAYLHALAGEQAATTVGGQAGVLAGDVRDALPRALADLRREDKESDDDL